MTVNAEEIQEKYYQFQYLQQQIEQINQHLESLMQQNVELDVSINALKELEKVKVNTEILSPIANGVFIRCKLQDNQKLVVNVGSDVTLEKTIPEVVELLEMQKKEFDKSVSEADLILQELSSQAMKIYQEIESKQ